MKKTISAVFLFMFTTGVSAFHQNQQQHQLQGQQQGQLQGQLQGQKQQQAAIGVGVGVGIAGAGVNYAPNVNADIPKQAIAPNPYASPPSAQCRYGQGLTGAVAEFGIGISSSEWDAICGLWLASQQTVGPARDEAAAAAFCMTMDKAGVESQVCNTWGEDQQAQVAMNEHNAVIVFSGVGGGGGYYLGAARDQ